MKGVSIPINTLVMLAVAIIVLLAAVAWFMGAFAPAATESSYKQKFESSCTIWAMSNCGDDSTGSHEFSYPSTTDKWAPPDKVYNAYDDWKGVGGTAASDYIELARACGCSEPFGQERPIS